MTEADEPAAEQPEAGSAPDATAPEAAFANTASESDTPDSGGPDSAPEANAPEANAADPGTSDSAVSESAMSESTVSESDVPETDLPDAAQADGSEPSGDDESDAHGRHRSKKPKRKAPWWELPALVVGAIALAILLKSFVLQPFYIPSESMEKTLHGCQGCAGDRILVNKVIYDFRDPHPGDIVVFHAPQGWNDATGTAAPTNPFVRAARGFGQLIGFVPPDGEVLVKRVIATGGQTVRGIEDNGKDVVQISDHGAAGPWRNLVEPYVYTGDGVDNMGAFGPVTVPKGRLWVMGDHRNDSLDSRYHCGPDATNANTANCDPTTSTVPNGNVIGKAFVIAWPPSRWRTLGTPVTFKNGG
jgi:signal peptidase I